MGLAVLGTDLLLYIVSVSYGQLFFFTFSRVLFVVHIFILPSLDFVQTFLCIHIAQTKMATYNDGVAIYPIVIDHAILQARDARPPEALLVQIMSDLS